MHHKSPEAGSTLCEARPEYGLSCEEAAARAAAS